jgi:hypothetical protein
VTGILTGLERLESEFQIDKPPADLSIFGFKDENRIRVEPKQGEALVVTLGSDTPVAGQRYVRLEGRKSGVFGVKKQQAEGLTINLYGLRDKRMSLLDPKLVDHVALRVSGKPVMSAERGGADEPVAGGAAAKPPDGAKGEAAAKGDDSADIPPPRWTIREPLEERGDPDRITRLVQDLYFARADGFVDKPGKPEEYGLAQPEVELELKAGDKAEHVKLGRVTPGPEKAGEKSAEKAPDKPAAKPVDKFYLQIDDRAPVYEVPERLLSGVGRDLFAYRYKRVFTASEQGLGRVELLFPRDGARYALSREKGQDDWKPEGDAWKLRSALAPGDMLFELYQLDATALIDKPDRAALGLEPRRALP